MKSRWSLCASHASILLLALVGNHAYADVSQSSQATANVASVIDSTMNSLELQAGNLIVASGTGQSYAPFLPAGYTPNANIITSITQASSAVSGVTVNSDA